MNIAVLGAGAFGSALAVTLAHDGRAVTLWARDSDAIARMTKTRVAEKLDGVAFPDDLRLTGNIDEACMADIVIVATPAQTLATLLARIDAPLSGKAIVAACKGLDLDTWSGPSGTIAAARPGAIPLVLTGPSFAIDIARGLPTALTLACTDAGVCRRVQTLLSTPTLRLYRSADPIGAELGGALKNVVAIACGACIGAGLGDSARAALMTRGFAEMQRLALALGARPETLMGMAGLGDLALTCTSPQSRNFRLGVALGRGAQSDPGITVEGAATARAATALAADRRLDLPVCATTDAIIRGHVTVGDALQSLLSRPLKEE